MSDDLKQLKPLTDRQALISEAFLENGGKITEQDAEAAGYASLTTAKAALQNPTLKAHLSNYLDDAGATLRKSAEVIAGAHDATETKFFAFEGEVRDEKTVVDHKTRLSAAKLNLEARGELNSGVNVTFNKFGDLTDEELAKIALGQAPANRFLPGGLAE